ncbi:MAG: oxidoreductase [Acidimicrobiia bacterium]|nr:oxidoreductase [Acidimicrobiia bacterium]MDH5293091.1 oxidoreductase [Acidimicrobiia bacterium]
MKAFVVEKTDGGWERRVRALEVADLPDGDVLIEVDCSGINYKDGLASVEKGRVARISPLIPGVDLAGTVVESSSDSVTVGSEVIVHGYDLGVAHHGGFAEMARVPAGWVVPLPAGLTTRQAMVVGTAGYTAALSVMALEAAGLKPGDGQVLVTGATGGVGSTAVGLLANRGYEVVASTGKPDQSEWLKGLGAADVVDRSETSADSGRPLESERWAGAVDCVGGATLAYVIRTLRYGASVAASGLTGGGDLPTTVYPFILRGVNLLGIDSVMNALPERIEVWHRISTDLRPLHLEPSDVVGLDGLTTALDRILAGGMVGRTLVDPRA